MTNKKMSSEDKELKLVNLKKDLANAEKEIDMISKTKEDQLRRRAWVESTHAARKQMHEAAMKCENGFRHIKPTFHFQTSPEYEAAQAAVSESEFQGKVFEYEDTLAKIDHNIKSKDEQIVSQTNNAESLRKQIAELEK